MRRSGISTPIPATRCALICNTIANEKADDRVRLTAAVKLLQLGFTGYEKMEVSTRLEAVEAAQADTRNRLNEQRGGVR